MKKALRPFVAMLGIALLAILIAEWRFRTSVPAIRGTGPNAVWLRHSWVGESHTADEYQQLAGLLRLSGLTDAYVHAGPLEWDGTVKVARIMNARDFIGQMKRLCPYVRFQAYLGQIEAGGGGPLDLSSKAVRESIVQTAAGFLDVGFDGIHYDIEPIHSNNFDFLILLDQTREITRARDATLSVAACRPEPLPGIVSVARLFCRNPGFWTRRYFLQVARRADQTAVMVYDSALPLPALYGAMTAWIVRWCDRREAGRILIGIPTYDQTPSHNPMIESPRNTITGMKRGLSDVAPERRRNFGVAVFAEWTTTDGEWETIRRLWSSPKAP